MCLFNCCICTNEQTYVSSDFLFGFIELVKHYKPCVNLKFWGSWLRKNFFLLFENNWKRSVETRWNSWIYFRLSKIYSCRQKEKHRNRFCISIYLFIIRTENETFNPKARRNHKKREYQIFKWIFIYLGMISIS